MHAFWRATPTYRSIYRAVLIISKYGPLLQPLSHFTLDGNNLLFYCFTLGQTHNYNHETLTFLQPTICVLYLSPMHRKCIPAN